MTTLGYRPPICYICHKPLTQASTGRPRLTCSDRCRQLRRRREDIYGWIDPRNFQKRMNRAERELRKIEKKVGSLAIPVRPEAPQLTLRDQLRIRLMRLERGDRWSALNFCVECGRPYISESFRKPAVCSEACRTKFYGYTQRIWKSLKNDPRHAPRPLIIPLLRYKKYRLCEYCNRVYRSRDVRRKYCSDQCRKKAWWHKNPHWKCRHCGVPTVGREHYCSNRCYQRDWSITATLCARCNHVVKPGAEIYPNADTRIPDGVKRWKRQRPVVFCSGRCRDALGWLPTRKICEECRSPYYAITHRWHHHQKYCSPKCRERANNRLQWQHIREARPPRFCVMCNAPLNQENPRKYCSKDCAKLGTKALARQREVRKRAIPLGIPLGIPVQLPIRDPVQVPMSGD